MNIQSNIRLIGKAPLKLISAKAPQISARRSQTIAEDSHDLGQIDVDNKLAVLTLYDNGIIRYCNKACARLLGCTSSKLMWQHISTIFPQLTEVALVKGERVNPYLRFLSRVGYRFEVVGLGGMNIACRLFFNEVENLSQHCLRVIVQPVPAEPVAA